LAINKYTRIPIAEGIDSAMDLPHTLTQAILYRLKINSLNELPKDKKPSRNLWDKPYELDEYLDEIWDTKSEKKGKTYVDIDLEEVE
jgi:hypothetical protein